MKYKKNGDGFIQGIMALMMSQVLIKILGLCYSVFLTNKNGFGDSGNAIYMSGYQIYALLLAISSIGIPNAIAKVVSEKLAIGDDKGADRIFKVAFCLFSLIGFSCTMVLFCMAKVISQSLLGIPEAEYTLKALSPAIFFVAISSVIRGYCNGKKEITVTAHSQTVEQLFKTILTIICVEIIAHISCNDTTLMAAGANLATTFATMISFIDIFYISQKHRKIILHKEIQHFRKDSIRSIVKKIFAVSIPMSLSSLLATINKNIDSVTVVRLLKKPLGESVAKIKYGILSTKVDILVAMPLAFNIAFATVLVPEIAGSLVKNDFQTINRRLHFSLLITILIGLPCTLGMFVYANQILNLLFPNANSGASLLKLASITIIFTVLTQTMNGALQGLGKNKIPAIGLFCGVIVKFLTNIILIPIDGIYEKGSIIGTILCHMVAFTISYHALRKTIHLKFNLVQLLWKPVMINGIMIGISYFLYTYIINLKIKEYIATIIGIISAVIVYIIFIFLFKILAKEDIEMLPKGEKIYLFLKKMKIYS